MVIVRGSVSPLGLHRCEMYCVVEVSWSTEHFRGYNPAKILKEALQ